MPDEIQVRFTGIADFITAISDLQTRLLEATRQATIKAAQAVQSAAVSSFNTPPGPTTRTGNLQRSIKTFPVQQVSPGRFRATVGPTAVYGRIIELGGTITPKEKDFLSWIGVRADGSIGFIRKRSVTIAPHPYFTPGYVKARALMPQIFQDAWTQAITGS